MKRNHLSGLRPSLSIGAIILFVAVLMFSGCSKDKNPVNSNSNLTVTDIDGNTYRTVKIGKQWWMAENLKVTHYLNGDAIPRVGNEIDWSNLVTGAHWNEYDAKSYGLIYNWYAVSDSRIIAPMGWHVPSDQDWMELEMSLGMSRSEADEFGWRGREEGGKLKETGVFHWYEPNAGATNESGFSALPVGWRYATGGFPDMGSDACFWSSSEAQDTLALHRNLNYQHSDVYRGKMDKRYGFSVRLISD
jgi:uncharacterized protein (TIGR02145 family)